MAWVCGRSLGGTVGSNPARGMEVSCDCWVLLGWGLCVEIVTRPEEFYLVWFVWLWLRGGTGPLRSVAPWGGARRYCCKLEHFHTQNILFFQDIPVLMLPSLLVQLLVQTSHALVHTMFLLVSGSGDMTYGLIVASLCITYIGKTKISCSMCSVEIIYQVLIQKCLLYFTTRSNRILPKQCIHVFHMMLPVSSYYFTNSCKFFVGVHKEDKTFPLLCRNGIPVRPIPMAGRSLAGMVGSNPAGDMKVCLLWVLCVVR